MSHHRQKLELYIEQKGICPGCNLLIENAKDITIDHIIPKTAGGENRRANYQLMHARCNSLKGNKLP